MGVKWAHDTRHIRTMITSSGKHYTNCTDGYRSFDLHHSDCRLSKGNIRLNWSLHLQCLIILQKVNIETLPTLLCHIVNMNAIYRSHGRPRGRPRVSLTGIIQSSLERDGCRSNIVSRRTLDWKGRRQIILLFLRLCTCTHVAYNWLWACQLRPPHLTRLKSGGLC